MESKEGIDSETPTLDQTMNDPKLANIENDDPEKGSLSDPPSEPVQDSALAKSDPNAFPDGGFEAWFCIAGGFCTIFSSFGWINCMMPITPVEHLVNQDNRHWRFSRLLSSPPTLVLFSKYCGMDTGNTIIHDVLLRGYIVHTFDLHNTNIFAGFSCWQTG
jgi:hypothetical protein